MWRHDRLKAKDYKGQLVNWAQYKRDGHRLTVFKQDTGQVVALTTSDHDISLALKHWGWWLPIVDSLPCSSSLDGELYVPGQPPSNVKTALNAHDPNLRFEVFAVPYLMGVDCRSNDLEWCEHTCRYYQLPFVPCERFDASKDYLEDARAMGLEGWVFKRANYEGWFKFKLQRTIDAFVIGFKDGNGKHLGLVGSLQCAVWYKHEHNGSMQQAHIANVGGMDDDTRLEIDEKLDLMRVCEIAYQEIGSRGRLRHPRFLRWRDDKKAKDCVIEQDHDLVRIWNPNCQKNT